MIGQELWAFNVADIMFLAPWATLIWWRFTYWGPLMDRHPEHG